VGKIIIQKFGGTSVQDADAMRRVITIVKKHGLKRGIHPLIVLSACAGVTNTLIRIGELSLLGKIDQAHKVISELDKRHFGILHDLHLSLRGEQEASLNLRYIWRELRTIVRGIELLGELTPKMKDKLLSAGERASTTIFSHALREDLTGKGIAVHLFDAREFFLTDFQFGSARPQVSEITKQMKLIGKRLASGAVGVSQGFIGVTKRGETTTIGRGGSDFSATIMGVALGAKEIQIWTDVAGIYTCDPRIVPKAYAQPKISFEDASVMAYFGAKVLHPETIGPAVDAGIPVRVLSSKEPEKKGTTILMQPADGVIVTGIAIKRNIILAKASALEMVPKSKTMTVIFDALRNKNIIPLASSISFDDILFALEPTERYSELHEQIDKIASLQFFPNRAMLTIVGQGLFNNPGIAARIFGALRQINCEMISYGGAENAIHLVVPDEEVEIAAKSIHKEFFSSSKT
jgi:aspartate kinase